MQGWWLKRPLEEKACLNGTKSGFEIVSPEKPKPEASPLSADRQATLPGREGLGVGPLPSGEGN